MSYRLQFKSKALKFLESPGYRTRIGVYRVIYSIDDGALVVLVLDIDHRRDAYR